MILANARRKRRQAATLVETAFVLVPLFMFILGIFEYGGLLMDWNLLVNATQVGCRYALANNTSASVSQDVQTLVTQYMAGRTSNFSSFSVKVSGTHGGIVTPVNSLSAGDPITVTVTGNYNLLNIVPLVSQASLLPMSCSSTMMCEGGTN